MVDTITTMWDKPVDVLTGRESYPIIGGGSTSSETINAILRACAGLPVCWRCEHKAAIAQKMIGKGGVYVGSMYIKDGDGSYGF